MTQARTRANGLVIPSLPQLWLTAMLRAFVELVLHAVSNLQMIRRRLPAECYSDVTPTDLPGETNGTQQQETELAAQQGSSALILRDREAIVSKDEGVLTAAGDQPAQHRDCPFLVPLIPAKAGTQSCNGTRATIPHPHLPPWIPIFIGMSGICVPSSAPA